jgi:hypothetical protein
METTCNRQTRTGRCQTPATVLGLCNSHYQNAFRNDPDELNRRRLAKAMRPVPVCEAKDVIGDGCTNNATHRNGLCPKHYNRLMAHGDVRIARVFPVRGVQMDTVKAHQMRRAHQSGTSVTDLARDYGLPADYVAGVVKGLGWSEV